MSKASEIIENLFESVKDKPKLDRVVSISESTWNMCYKEIGDIEKEHNRVCKVFNDKIIEQFNQIEQLKKENAELKSLMSVQLDMLEQNKQMSAEIEQLKKEKEKLFSVYEECRSDNTAHFRKILELQKENDQLKSKLKVAVENFEKIKNLECKHQACSIAARGVAQLALKEIES